MEEGSNHVIGLNWRRFKLCHGHTFLSLSHMCLSQIWM